jgi:hypothetical protein
MSHMLAIICPFSFLVTHIYPHMYALQLFNIFLWCWCKLVMILLLWQHINLGHLLTWFIWKVQHQNLQVGWVTYLLCLYEACVTLACCSWGCSTTISSLACSCYTSYSSSVYWFSLLEKKWLLSLVVYELFLVVDATL